MNFTLLVAVLLTAIAFVGIVIALSNAIAPRSYNVQKMEPYECGIPTRGKSWMQFRVGYYLFAFLLLSRRVPWNVKTRCWNLSTVSYPADDIKSPCHSPSRWNGATGLNLRFQPR